MKTRDAIASLTPIVFFAAIMYCGIAFTIFQWRNPTANRLSFWRDFGAVMRFEKLAKYQGVQP